jgi:hypothetical protein
VNETVVLFTGMKNAGKTSLILRFLDRGIKKLLIFFQKKLLHLRLRWNTRLDVKADP